MKKKVYNKDIEIIENMVHEIVTPIIAIEGYSSIVLDKRICKIDNNTRKYTNKINKSSKRLLDLINDFSVALRIENNKLIYNIEKVNTKTAIDEVISELGQVFHKKKIKLVLDESLDNEYQVLADRNKLHQVLINIVGNAYKYTIKGLIRISIKKEKSFIVIMVSDTGIGIPKTELPLVFKEYFRAVNANEVSRGTGLGLYISYQLIKMMKGCIKVKTVLDKGSKFIISLPCI